MQADAGNYFPAESWTLFMSVTMEQNFLNKRIWGMTHESYCPELKNTKVVNDHEDLNASKLSSLGKSFKGTP